MKVTRETSLKYAIWILETATDKNLVQHPVWVVADPFCEMRYVSNGGSLPGDEASEGKKLRKERKNSVDIYHTESSSSVTSFISYELPAVRKSPNMKFSEVPFLNYGNSQEFN